MEGTNVEDLLVRCIGDSVECKRNDTDHNEHQAGDRGNFHDGFLIQEARPSLF